MEIVVHLLIYSIHTYEPSTVRQAVDISLVVFKLCGFGTVLTFHLTWALESLTLHRSQTEGFHCCALFQWNCNCHLTLYLYVIKFFSFVFLCNPHLTKSSRDRVWKSTLYGVFHKQFSSNSSLYIVN